MRRAKLTSSPLSAPPSQQTTRNTHSQSLPEYRQARKVPFELAQHVQIYFEEAMFMQAFRLLISIISADASSVPSKLITVPSPRYLALTATLAVHPFLTTRAPSSEKQEQANSALRLLRLLLKSAGPVNAGFDKAFAFTRFESKPSRRRGVSGSNNNNDEDEETRLNTPYAEADSLWSRAEDFWATVGWALNCSCLPGMYAARWEHWSLWLEFMLEVLEADWEFHYAKDTCEESLLWQYIELAPGGNARARRMLRATFADGSVGSLNEFGEIFRKELKEPVREEDKVKKREVDVNIDAEVYGDYMTRDDSDTSSDDDNDSNKNPRPRKQRRTRTPSRHPTPRSSNQSLRSEYDNEVGSNNQASGLGSPRSITIRLRLLHLLSHVGGHPTLTSASPTTFPGLDDLYTLFVEFIKPLPLPTFQQLVSPSLNPHTVFSTDAHITLCEFLLQRTIESAAPSVRSERFLTQRKLEEEYLPFAASRATVDANCRVSLLLEALLRRLKGAGCLQARKELTSAVDEGVKRRLDKASEGMESARSKKKRSGNVNEEEILDWLVESGARMKMVAASSR